MSKPNANADPAEIDRAVKLLQLRDSGDDYRKLAVERKIKQLPAHVHAAAKAKVSKPAGDGDGAVQMPADTITVGKDDMTKYQAARGEAQTAIGREIDRAVGAVQQGHRQGYTEFRNWYRKWEKAKEESSAELASKVCGFLLGAGLDIIFPEEEVFIGILKTAMKGVYSGAEAAVGQAGISEGNIQQFLDAVWTAEEKGITSQLDVHDKFFDSGAPVVEDAIDSFITARMDGWDSTEKLPAKTLEILKKAGVGTHGSAAATVIAERVTTAHISAVLGADSGVRFATRGEGDIETMAELATLRQEQSLPSVDNRNRMWTLERKIPDMYRTMSDINNDSSPIIHVRLSLDHDTCDEIVASREKDGPFKSSDDLLARKLLKADELKEVQDRVVCY